MNWRETKIGESFDVKHGYAFKGRFFGSEGEHIVVTPGNFNEAGGFRDRGEKEKFYTQPPPQEYVLRKGDLVIAMTEQSEGLLGSSALIPADGRYLHNQRIGLIVDLDESILHQRFLYYLFNTRNVRMQIRATATGTKVKHTAPSRIRAVVAKLPSIRVQKRIADILLAYDNLLENNNRRMTLLEQAIHLIYREWFVYLRFPGHEGVQIVGGAPEGWEKTKLGEIVSQVRDSTKPEEVEPATPYVGLEHLPRRCIALQEWGRATDVVSNKYRFEVDDILFGKIRPYFHKVVVAPVTGICSSDTIVMRCVDERDFPLALSVASSKSFVDHVWQTAKIGAKMPRANWKVMKEYPVLKPSFEVMSQFREIVEPSVAQILNLVRLNRRLREARDLLIPRLMNGSIPV